MTVEIGGLRLEHPVLNGSGTFDAISAGRAFGDCLLEHFPFSGYVSKTITLAPRAAAWGANRAPSSFCPRSATKIDPGVARRESYTTPVAASPEDSSGSPGIAGSSPSATRVSTSAPIVMVR